MARKSKKLFKTTIVVWSEYDTSTTDLEDIAREAVRGEAYCSKQSCEQVKNPTKDKDWDGTEFFNL